VNGSEVPNSVTGSGTEKNIRTISELSFSGSTSENDSNWIENW
jgi:hypothetical protein